MAGPRKNKKSQRENNSQLRQASLSDDLAAFQDFKEDILPALRKDLTSGLSAEEIYKKYQGVAAARSVTIMATERDSARAISAIKDILDRVQGKAKERQEVTHRFNDLSDEELDSFILSQAFDDETVKTEH